MVRFLACHRGTAPVYLAVRVCAPRQQICLLPANVPVGVVLAFLVLGCEQNPHFRGKCMWHVRVWVWSMPRFMPMLPVTCVAQAQESEALPLGDL